MVKKLHLGCGPHPPAGWVNLDGSWNAWLGKYPALRKLLRLTRLVPPAQLAIGWDPDILFHNVRKPLPFADNYFSAVYASHLLEHLYLSEAQALLQECYRVLRPGGILRMVVPDLKAMVDEYLAEPGRAGDKSAPPVSRADRLNRRLLLRNAQPPAGSVIYRLYTVWQDLHSHKWAYDAESLAGYFVQAGFRQVQERQAHESRIEGIEQIENPERIKNGAGVCLEGIKPGSGRL